MNDNTRHGAITRNVGQGIKVEFSGDWVRLSQALDKLPLDIATSAIAAQEAAAMKYRKAIRRNIRDNAFGFQNKPKYAAVKAALGGGNVPLIWSKLLYKSIILKRSGAGMTVQVTVDPNARYSSGSHQGLKAPKLSVKQIAMVLEHGSSARNIQAFPVWRLTYAQLGGKLFFQTFMAKSMGIRLSRKVR